VTRAKNMHRTRPPERVGEMANVVRLTAQLPGVRWCRRIELNSGRFFQPMQVSLLLTRTCLGDRSEFEPCKKTVSKA
jgi:hypothetical protein